MHLDTDCNKSMCIGIWLNKQILCRLYYVMGTCILLYFIYLNFLMTTGWTISHPLLLSLRQGSCQDKAFGFMLTKKSVLMGNGTQIHIKKLQAVMLLMSHNFMCDRIKMVFVYDIWILNSEKMFQENWLVLYRFSL